METDATNLILYSDSCGGQNRNIFLVCLWLHIVASSEYSFTNIDHNCMFSGQFLCNDWDFGHIELQGKKNFADFCTGTLGTGKTHSVYLKRTGKFVSLNQ